MIKVIKKMLVTTEAEATPNSEEAQRILGFFINSLGHPSLDKPPSLDKMWSWSILTPLYEEDVMYALDSKALGELGAAGWFARVVRVGWGRERTWRPCVRSWLMVVRCCFPLTL